LLRRDQRGEIGLRGGTGKRVGHTETEGQSIELSQLK
jgi:hypothetical protein